MSPSRTSTASLLATIVVVAIAAHKNSDSLALPQAEAPQKITFNRDIAPIIFQNCASCHHPGEAGPFPLLTYQDVRKHARQIAEVTRLRLMPPWLPQPGESRFVDELRLSDQQIARIETWLDQGMVEGNAADLPPPPQFIEGWQLGKPDLMVSARKPFLLPPSGTDRYWNFILPVPIRETHWLKAIEIRPGDKRLIHHANILVDRTQSARRREKKPGAGFGGMDLGVESEFFDPDSHFLFWKPGTRPYLEPDGMALRLDKGTDLVLNMHLKPSGKPELITPSVGLYFTAKPAILHPMLLQIENDAKLDIPAGEKNFLVTDSFTLPVDVDVLAIYPHAHYLGKDIQGRASLPDGSRRTLIHIPHWDLNWQAVYRYREPVFLPQGTVISMRYTYDNSAENLVNPNHPPRRVTAGNRASDEMAHLWLQVLPRNLPEGQDDPRMRLQQALAEHKLERDPGDFAAHYNLAAMLEASGKLQDAVSQYELALEIRPRDAVTRNALGGALLAAGRVDQAIVHLAAALKERPDYFDAHYNLGNALATQGDFGGAVEQFRAAVRLHPADADAEANLGSALAETGHFSEAKSHFERALKLTPNHALARENLEQLEQRTSR
jgi:Flp pilus assembly protein TadD